MKYIKILEYFNRIVFGETIENLIKKREELDQTIIDLQTQLKTKSEIKSPLVVKIITKNKINTIISGLGIINKNFADNSYNTCTLEDAKTFQKKLGINLKKWITEKHDCDDFSFESMGYWRKDESYSYFVVWSSGHAFNLFIDNLEQIWIVEPQNSNFYSIEDALKISSPDGINYFPIKTLIG